MRSNKLLFTFALLLSSFLISNSQTIQVDEVEPGVSTNSAGPGGAVSFTGGNTAIGADDCADLAGNDYEFTITIDTLDQYLITSCGTGAPGFLGMNVSLYQGPGGCGSAVIASDQILAPGGCVTISDSLCPGQYTLIVTGTAADGLFDLDFSFSDASVPEDSVDVITCPAPITVNTGPACGTIVNYGPIVVSDYCGIAAGPTLVGGLGSGSSFTNVTTEIWEATDNAGNIDSCSFTITVVDNDNPNINCPVSINDTITDGTCSKNIVFPNPPLLTDNCIGLPQLLDSLVITPPSGVFNVGAHTITYTVSDTSGGGGFCNFTLTVVDTTPPVLICPAPITVDDDGISCSQVVTFTFPTVTDNCDITDPDSIYQFQGLVSGSAFPGGVTTQAYEAIDTNGVRDTCFFDIAVVDTTPPIITCPNDTTLSMDPGSCDRLYNFIGPDTSDFCSATLGAITLTQPAGIASGGTFPADTTIMTFQAADVAGNMVSCSFDVVVHDSIPPLVGCPAPVLNRVNNTAICGRNVFYGNQFSFVDNCTVDSVFTLISGPAHGGFFPVGLTSVSVELADSFGNAIICNFDVSVVDTTAPVITCPAPVTVDDDGISCSQAVTFTYPTATDNCDITNPDSVHLFQGLVSTSAFPVGITTQGFEAVDTSGLRDTCYFDITVVDTTSPTFTCPADTHISTSAISCDAVYNFLPPVASDLCSPTPLIVVAQTVGPASGSTFPQDSTLLTFTGTDTAGNIGTCSYNVIVDDSITPTVVCPNPVLNRFNNLGICGRNVVYGNQISFTDNCTVDSVFTLISGPAHGGFFPVGLTSVSVELADSFGNAIICNFDVSVVDTTAPVITCPAPITVDDDGTSCSQTVTFTYPTATDNCDITNPDSVHLFQGLVSTSAFPVGITTQGFEAVDTSGLRDTCYFDITVVDTTPPTFTCPADTHISTSAISCDAVYNFLPPVATDLCSPTPSIVVAQTVGPASGSTFPQDSTLLTFTATDTAGNIGICSYNVIVDDSITPTVGCPPANLDRNNDPGMCGRNTFYHWAISYSDNCDADSVMTLLSGPANGALFPVGVTSLSVEVADSFGNSVICNFTITIHDTIAPISTCPLDTIVPANGASCDQAVSFTGTATDNCTAPVDIVWSVAAGSIASGGTFPLGVNLQELISTDSTGNSDTCTFTVFVLDTTSPVLICPNDTIYYGDGVNCGNIINYSPPVFTDNCSPPRVPGVPNFLSGVDNGDFADVGIHTSTWEVLDIAGNYDTCTFQITVLDTTIPVITCPNDTIVGDDGTNCGTNYVYLPPVTTDACAFPTLTSVGLGSGAYFAVGGPYTEKWISTDTSGNVDSCSFTITIADSTPPVITCPNDTVVSNLPTTCTQDVNYSPATAIDNCAPNIYTIDGYGPGNTFPVGINIEKWLVDDLSGNLDSCTFTVTVIDTTKPTIVCPNDTTLFDDGASCASSYTYLTPIVSENCQPVSPVLISGIGIAGPFPVGVSAEVWQVTDTTGNMASCSFSITVIDTTSPIITCPNDTIVSDNGVGCGANVIYAPPVGSDNCAFLPFTNVGLGAGGFYPVGVSTEKWIITDLAGNMDSCSFTITVNDTTPPIITCGNDTTAFDNGTGCGNNVSYTAATASDNCGIITPFTITGFNIGNFFPVGVSTETWQISDAGGNISSCSLNVTVIDTTPPVITCPNDTIIGDDGTTCGTNYSYALPITSDYCGPVVPTLLSGIPVGGYFSFGITSISYQAADTSGNIDSCSFTIEVKDMTPPTIVCPSDTVVSDNGVDCGNIVIYPVPVGADNCVFPTFSNAGLGSGSMFPVGISTETWTATDGEGNTSTCSFTVTVIDTTIPVITCPNDTIVTDDGISCTAIVNYSPAVATDSCALNPFIVTGFNSGGVFPVGVNVEKWMVSDTSGNSDSCSFTVTVLDTTPPTISCPSDIDVDNDGTACFSLAVNYSPAIGIDFCGPPTVSLSTLNGLPSGSIFPVGPNPVTWIAEDASGNMDSCTFYVNVSDTTSPTITCPAAAIQFNDPGACGAVVSIPSPILGDNCGTGLLSISNDFNGTSDATDFYPVSGGITVEWTVADTGGNSSTCSHLVIVFDNEDPVISCPADTTVPNDSAFCSANIVLPAPTASDNCGIVTPVNSINGSGDASGVYPLDTTIVTWTVLDVSGKIATCNHLVIVQDTQKPIIICPVDTIISVDSGACDAAFAMPLPTLSDNCPAPFATNDFNGLNDGSDTYAEGVNTVNWTVWDSSGNLNNCSMTVSVIDTFFPVLACPNDTVHSNDPGICEATFDPGIPVWSDNCPGSIVINNITGTNNASATYQLDTTIVTWMVTDITGNVSTCDQNVIVEDNEDPIISFCPGNRVRAANSGSCSRNIYYNAFAYSDNCSGVSDSVVTGYASGGEFPIGDTDVLIHVYDPAGNTASCAFTVTIADSTFPMISCPANDTIFTDVDSCAGTYMAPSPVYSDNCLGPWITNDINGTNDASGMYPLGLNTITWTVSDSFPNISSCSYITTVLDSQNPIAICPMDTVIPMDPGSCDAVFSYTVSTTDNCSGAIINLSSGLSSGSVFPSGFTTNTFIAQDPSGNIGTCSFTIEVIDTEIPQVFCPVDTTIVNNIGFCSGFYVYAVSSSDNCFGETIIQSVGLPTNSSFPVGFTTNTFIVMDATGNLDSCSFVVEVQDVEPPVISCPGNITANNDLGECGAIINYSVSHLDNCMPSSISQIAGLNSGSFFPIGVTINGFEATDLSSNLSNCAFTVTIIDNEAPILSCPSNISVPNDTFDCASIVNYSVLGTDNCPGEILAQSSGLTTGSAFPLGTTVNEYWLFDLAGNSVNCIFEVEVYDVDIPALSCPTDSTINVISGSCDAPFNYSISSTDNCPGEWIIHDFGLVSGTTFPLGNSDIQFSVIDSALNTSSCNFTVTVVDNQAPIITCPPNVVLNSEPGMCSAAWNYMAPIVTENCSGGSLILDGLTAGSQFPVGINTVSYEFVDVGGNSDSCSFTVTVYDNEDPEIFCPANITQTNDLNDCGAILNFPPAFGTDNCAVNSIIQLGGLVSGSSFPVGITTNTFEVSDNSGNTVSCSFFVVITDNQDPLITCPGNAVLMSDPNECGAIHTYPMGSSDNCPGELIYQNTGIESGFIFPIGLTHNHFTVTDGSGNTDTCSFEVTVMDNEEPSIACPGDLVVTNDTLVNGAVILYSVTTSDNCSNEVLTQTSGLSSGSLFPIGTTVNSFISVDSSGNSNTCSFNVVVVDDESPLITCPGDTMIFNDPNDCMALVPYVVTTFDNDGGEILTLVSGLPSGSFFPIGLTENIYEVEDISGNTAQCSFEITVVDTQFPEILLPLGISVNNDPGLCGAMVTYSVSTDDNCSGESIILNSGLPSGSLFPIGITSVIYEVTDQSGNITVESFDVEVTDVEDPEIFCPSDIVTANDYNQCNSNVTYTITADDNCSGFSVTQQTGLPSGAEFPLGTTINSFTVSDLSGHTATCSFNVMVNDGQPPVALCPPDTTIPNNDAICGAIFGYSVSGFDNCGPFVVNQLIGVPSMGLFPTGNTTNQFAVLDPNGNSSICSFVVTVQDTTRPLISCPPDIALPATPGLCNVVVNYSISTSDNCPGEALQLVAGLASGTPFEVGLTENIFVVTDGYGNTSSCGFDVTISDDQDPIITCPSDMVISSDLGLCGAIVSFDLETEDNCGVLAVTQMNGLASGAVFPIGVTQNEFEVSDHSGNTSSCSFNLEVLDLEAPTVTCPEDLVVGNDPGVCGAVVSFGFGESDNCSIDNVQMLMGIESGNEFPMGTVTVSYLISDVHGNSTVCNFLVTVEDIEAPIFNCPSNVVISNQVSECSAPYSFVVSATDNCNSNPINQVEGFISGSNFPVGQTLNVFEATDLSGNTSDCSFIVTVEDQENPTLTCPGSTVMNNDPGTCGAVYVFNVPHADNCPGSNLSQINGLSSGAIYPVGTTTNVLRATDAAGNWETCSFDITVHDIEIPNAICPGNVTVFSDPGSCDAVVGYNSVNGLDNCSIAQVTLLSGIGNGGVFPQGFTTEVYELEDPSGNKSSCSFTVEVIDNGDPVVVNCPSGFDQINDPSDCGAIVTYPSPEASDACSGFTTLQTSGLGSGSLFPVGTTTESFEVTDSDGNSTTCSFNVIVRDEEAPIINCPGPITITALVGQCSRSVFYFIPIVTDNCQGISILRTAGLGPSSTFPVGVTTEKYQAEDGSGNISTCEFEVRVLDPTAPVGLCPPSLVVNNDPGQCGKAISNPAPAFSDDCSSSLTITNTFTGTDNGSGNYPLGLTVVDWIITDESGNNLNCVQNITVIDNEGPELVTNNVTIYLGFGGSTSIGVNDVDSGTTDNCGLESLSLEQYNYSCSDLGVNSIEIAAIDENGNTSAGTVLVTVLDTIAPIANCQDITVAIDPVTLVANVAGSDLNGGSFDNCPLNSFSISQGTFTPADQGTNQVVLLVTDPSGNMATCESNVTVTVPGIEANCITSSVSLNLDPNGIIDISPSMINDGSSSAYGISSLEVNPSVITCSGIGNQLVTLTVTDNNGSTASCIGTVTVQDIVPPLATCVDASVNLGPLGSVTVTPSLIDFGSNDACGVTSLLLSQYNFNGSFLGPNNVTMTVLDANGNFSTCSSVVTVLPYSGVNVNCQNITLSVGAAGSNTFSASDLDAGYHDPADFTLSASHSGFDCSDIASSPIQVILTVEDQGGSTASCSSTISVVDTDDPVAFCTDRTVILSPTGTGSLSALQVGNLSSDVCGIPFLAISKTSFDCSDVFNSPIPVVLTATDQSGNSSTCSANITVEDQNAPSAICKNISITLNGVGAYTLVGGEIDGGTVDPCGVNLTPSVSNFDCSHIATSPNPVLLTAIDASGNTASCISLVTVQSGPTSSFTCPANATIVSTVGQCGGNVTVGPPTLGIGCGSSTYFNDFNNGTDASDFYPIGIQNVEWTLLDQSGNISTCSHTITVMDAESPIVSCPANFIVGNDQGDCGAVVLYNSPVATDNCGPLPVTMVNGLASGGNFPIGLTAISYEASDASGNMGSCSFSIQVNDSELPEITCPANISVPLNPNGSVIFYDLPTFSDNCAGVSGPVLEAGYPSLDTFPTGITHVEYSVTDAAGNTASCSFQVTVDNVPLCAQPINLSVSNLTGSTALVTWDNPSSTFDFQLAWREVGGTWETRNITTTSYLITGLTQNSNYEVKVKDLCNAPQTVFGWTSLVLFSTPSGICTTPINLTSVLISPKEVELSWEVPNWAPIVQIAYKPLIPGAVYSTRIVSGVTSLLISDLIPGTPYEWKIRDHCNSPNVPATVLGWGQTANFVTPDPPCSQPFDHTALNITSSSALLSWSIAIPSPTYLVAFRKIGGGVHLWNTRVVSTNQEQVLALEGGTYYEWKVKDRCKNPGTYNGWTDVDTFLTSAATCGKPFNLSSIPTSPTTADLSWSTIVPISDMQLAYKPVVGGTWTTFQLGTNSLSVSGLAPGITYQWKVKDLCGNPGTIYGFSDLAYFTTPTTRVSGNPGGTSFELKAPNVYPNPFTREVTVDFWMTAESGVTLEIIDLNGRLLKKENFDSKEGWNSTELKLDELPRGIYFLRLNSEGLNSSVKIEKR